MGRYKQQSVIIREHEELTIVIESKDTIWVLPKRASTNIIFHRWFSPPLGTWRDWHLFRQKLYTNKNVTLDDCYRWARQHEIQSQGTARSPDIEKLKYATTAKRSKKT